MIDISVSEVATEVLVAAIGTTGRWLATAARAPRGRKAEDLSVARWFETYRLTDSVPDLAGLRDTDAERLAEVLRGPGVQAALQELLAARLTDAPENDAARARDAFVLTLAVALPPTSSFASVLADFYDEQICALVARLEAGEPTLLTQIRSEALSARMIAVLRAIERHTAAISSAPRDTDTFLASYRRQVIEQHGKLQPPDFERRRRVPVEDIYVPATIYEDLSPERIVASAESPPSLEVWELAARADRSVLLGDPGGGKTTASNVLMHHFASDPARRVPFLVTLRDFARDTPPALSVVGHIEHELETFYQCPAPPGLVDMLLLTGRAIVFFDGLDELLDTSRRADVADRVERFCTEYPLAPVLVTSRVVGYDQARLDDQQFTCYRLGGFRDEDVETYARKWFALETGVSSDEADSFVSESESVPDLRSNPLLLSLMCILYRGEGSLPRNRAEIYEQCATLLFRKWDARRRIHQDLRAGHLVEPALRHLAWWLFTRSDTHSAITERELVGATTEFLHGRGFESLDEAREAAREFIEFCRGRMWVFTDTGTTATGEKLYSFTHRTFLEYFAAAQLAYDSDTPEKLARALTPHVAKGEWEVIGELAVQIKDSTSTGGVQRVYEYLLNDRRYSSSSSRSSILQFLARTLRSADPPPQLTRRLVREISEFLFSGDPNTDTHGLPFAWLLGSCTNCLTLVDEEISLHIDEMINSDVAERRLDGMRLAASMEAPLYTNWHEIGPDSPFRNKIREFWRNREKEYISKYSWEIIDAALKHVEIMYIALSNDMIAFDEKLLARIKLDPLMQATNMRIFNFAHSPYLQTCFVLLTYERSEPESSRANRFIAALTALGTYISINPHPPWISGTSVRLSDFYWDTPAESGQEVKFTISPYTYLGGAAAALISAGNDTRKPSDYLCGNPSHFGVFSDLFWYIESRETGTPAAESLPDLPVPDEFKQVFRDWAAGKVNFVGDPEDNK